MTDQNPYGMPGADLGAGGARLSDGHYEFSEAENAIVQKAAGRTTVWGVIAIVIGVLVLLALAGALLAVAAFGNEIRGEIDMDPTTLSAIVAAIFGPLAFVNLAIGWYYINAGRSLRAVVETQGNDVALMMSGLDAMATAFKIEAIVTVVAFCAGVLVNIVATAAQSQ